MKLLLTGDIHITGDRPTNRIDNYWETVKGKVKFILDTAQERGIRIVLCPGDFTDTPILSWIEFYEIQNLLRSYQDWINFYVTFGQHDMRYRTKPNTALMALYHSTPNIFLLDNTSEKFSDTHIYGCSYNSEVPEPDRKTVFNILLIHRMIIDKKLWSKQEEYEPSNLFLRQHEFDLIVSGDNHQPFDCKTPGGRWLFNCGAMMRNKIDMVEHKPYVVIFDTETKEHEKVYIPIKPAEEVFKMDKAIEEKEKNQELEAFVSGLSTNKEMDLKFEDNLAAYIRENQIPDEISSIAINSLKERRK